MEWLQDVGPYKIQTALIIQLAYYAGLREDEALSLRFQDVDFDTQCIYISNYTDRKSPSAVRKIPIALLPKSLVLSLSKYMTEWSFHHANTDHNKIFDEVAYKSREDELIRILRERVGNDEIVTHSLRHCAANNWLLLFSVMLSPLEDEVVPYFYRHTLITSQSLKQISHAFEITGRPINTFYHVLDWISQTLGHASPATTWVSYWHSADYALSRLFRADNLISKQYVRRWLESSQYVYELQKKLFEADNDWGDSECIKSEPLSQWVNKYWVETPIMSLEEVDYLDRSEDREVSLRLFSSFSETLLQHYHYGRSLPSELQEFLSSSEFTSSIEIPKIEHSEYFTWLRLCQKTDSWIRLSSFKRDQLKGDLNVLLQVLRGQQRASNLANVQAILKSYSSFGLTNLQFLIHGRDSDPKKLLQWKALLDENGASLLHRPSGKKMNLEARPYRLRWSLWNKVEQILMISLMYLDFLDVSEKHCKPRHAL